MASFLSQRAAQAFDAELMGRRGFTLDQLMELAGQAVAHAVDRAYGSLRGAAGGVLVVAGPGNNGGDGLVASRHLRLLGWDNVAVVQPKRSTREPLYAKLVVQAEANDVRVAEGLPDADAPCPAVLIDAVFGFSFAGDVRPPFDDCLGRMRALQRRGAKLVSVDVPSGWDVMLGGQAADALQPDMLVSLTLPKEGVKGASFPDGHYVGGRFVPPAMARELDLTLPTYPGLDQIARIDE